MKRKKIESQVQRRLLTALITSREFMSQAVPVLDLELIDNAPFQLIAGWSLDYFNKYNKAPGRDIETAYHQWSEDREGSEVEAVAALLEELSDSFEDADPINVPYLLEQTRVLLEKKGLERIQDNVDYALHTGNVDEAKAQVLNYRPVEIMAGLGTDPLGDEEAWERAFASAQEPLIEFPGDAGRFLNPALTRDGLIGIQGPEKRGKTWWCIEFVARALRERRKVAFFQVGDLSEAQVMVRLGTYWAERPSLRDHCGAIEVPRGIEKPDTTGEEDEEPLPTLSHRTREFNRPLTKQACIKACNKLKRAFGLKPDRTYIKVSVHANSSINVRGITSILDRWEMMEGFIPDIIVIDYADILAPEDPRQTPRDQVNETWKSLRRLSQERHCLVIAPTQADASSYDARTQTMRNFSEDKRKLAHVTGMLGLNQTEGEKALGVMRLNWLVLRESPFNVRQCLWVGQCLPIGRAFYCATL